MLLRKGALESAVDPRLAFLPLGLQKRLQGSGSLQIHGYLAKQFQGKLEWSICVYLLECTSYFAKPRAIELSKLTLTLYSLCALNIFIRFKGLHKMLRCCLSLSPFKYIVRQDSKLCVWEGMCAQGYSEALGGRQHLWCLWAAQCGKACQN